MEENKEFTTENEEVSAETEQTEKEPFVPSPRWKRIFAWVLFVIVVIGIICWLLNIAFPEWQWIDALHSIRSLL